MTDHFAALNQRRRPWLDPDSLKQKFLSLSAEVHPDRVHHLTEAEKEAATRRYTALNSAFNCLRNPKERVAHLLELELGHRPQELQSIPPDLADLFIEVARRCRQADELLADKKRTTSPLLLVSLFERAQQQTEELTAFRQRLKSQREALDAELKILDAAWIESADAATGRSLLTQLEPIYRLLSFFGRWEDQIQEKLFQLSF